jgi:hypothetical protein
VRVEMGLDLGQCVDARLQLRLCVDLHRNSSLLCISLLFVVSLALEPL